MSQLQGKTVLITGGSRGLGRQLALDFAQAGANVVVNFSSSAQEANSLLDEITTMGGTAIACKADIAKANEIKDMVDLALSTYGTIDILINNAGLSLDAPFLDLTEEQWDRVVDVNLKGPFLLSQAVAPSMMNAKSGRIINISANTAVRARVGNANYATSKAGLNMLTQSMAMELGPHIIVNAIALGAVDSPLLRSLFSKDELQDWKDSVPLKRMTTYEEVSAFVQMLAGEAAGFMTGQTIPFDGGKVMR